MTPCSPIKFEDLVTYHKEHNHVDWWQLQALLVKSKNNKNNFKCHDGSSGVTRMREILQATGALPLTQLAESAVLPQTP